MSKGRKPKSVERKIMEGNPGKRSLPAVTSVGGKGEIEKPSYLTKGASKYWDLYVPMMVESGLLDRCDVMLLAQFFEAMNMSVMCAELLQNDTDGVVIDQYNNMSGERSVKANPILSQWSKAVTVMKNIGSLYGLSPSDRARFSTINPADNTMIDADIGVPLRIIK